MSFVILDRGKQVDAITQHSSTNERIIDPAGAVEAVEKKESEGDRSEDPPSKDDRSSATEAYEQASTLTDDMLAVLAAKEIMSFPVETLSLGATIEESLQLFSEKQVSHVPILNESGMVIGILSKRDIIQISSQLIGAVERKNPALSGEAPVVEIMTPQVIATGPDTPVRSIAHALVKHGVGAIVVREPSGTLAGIVTRGDVLKALVSHAPLTLWA